MNFVGGRGMRWKEDVLREIEKDAGEPLVLSASGMLEFKRQENGEGARKMGKHSAPEWPAEDQDNTTPAPVEQEEEHPRVKFCGIHGPYNATYDRCPARGH